MASSLGSTTTIFSLLLLLSLAIQPNAARESKFFTKLAHYLSNSPIISSSSSSPTPAPTPVFVPGLEPMPEPVLAPGVNPVPAPAPVEKEYGYGLYGQRSGEYSSEEYRTSTLDQGLRNNIPKDEEEIRSPPFEKLQSNNNYNNNGYSSNENVYSNEKNGYNNNGYNYNNNYNNNYGNRFSTSMDENNDNYNTMGFRNENNGNKFTSPKDQGNDAYNNDNNNGYVMEQQGLSDTRFLENGKYSFDANNNGNNNQEFSSYEEEVNDINASQGYYNRNNVNEKSKYEFDTMEEYERQQGYPENDPSGYLP